MKKLIYFSAIVLLVLFAGCSSIPTDTVYQTSTIDALLAGVYDGDLTLKQVLEHGGFGIGTFDHLDGEMILLDGTVYQVKADGKVYTPAKTMKTPFATVCRFSKDGASVIDAGTDFDSLMALIDKQAPNKNLFYAIKITGEFRYMKTRSVPGQKKPYPPLKEITKNQPVFEMDNISGTIVGFRCPPYVKGINVPGYHLHFISEDRKQGGHILAFKTSDTRLELDMLDQYFLKLPSNAEDFALTDLSKDRAKDLEKVEK